MNGPMRTAVLLTGLCLFFAFLGLMLGGIGGMAMGLVIAALINVVVLLKSDKIVLGMHGAKLAEQQTRPELFDIVSNLSQKAQIPTPDIYVIEEDQPNAFAAGRSPKNSALAVTTGLLDLLDNDELSGVVAHEIAHIKNRDTLIMSVAATIAGAMAILANHTLFFKGSNPKNPLVYIGGLVVMALAPIGAIIVQMAIWRDREYEADRFSAELTCEPSWLASALGKLEKATKEFENKTAKSNPASAHMFIMNPLQTQKMTGGRGNGGIFSTHPPSMNRIMRLISLSAKKDWQRYGANDPVANVGNVPGRSGSIPRTRE